MSEGNTLAKDMSPPKREPPGTLYTKTQELLRSDSRTIFNIAKESGIPFYWLRKMNSGEISDPGVNRVQKLYEFLTVSNLQLK